MGFERVMRYVEEYEIAFYEVLRNKIQEYSELEEAMPRFIKGEKRIFGILCSDGILVYHFPSHEYSFEFIKRQNTVNEVSTEYGTPFQTRGVADTFDIELSEVRISYLPTGTTSEQIITLPWDRLEISSNKSLIRWNKDRARLMAESAVSTFIIAHLMNLPPDIDRKDVIASFEQLINNFETLLDLDPKEEAIQQYLTSNPVLLDPTAVEIFPKIPLGNEHVTDFVISTSLGDYILVEIERAHHDLFTKDGNPTRELTHARRQVTDWMSWIAQNRAYAKTIMPDITDPEGWVILGRHPQNNQNRNLERTKRETFNQFLRRENQSLHRIKIMTFDDILSKAKSHLNNLKRLI